MQSKATTIEKYLAELPPDRRAAIAAVRQTILKNLDKDYQECMAYGMIGYSVPHSIYPAGYHCDPKMPLPFACLASQKNHMAVYLMSVYGHHENEKWFREAWAKTGKKLDMGKSCIRFKKLEDLPLEVIGEAIRRMPAKKYIEYYETAIRTRDKGAAGKSASAKPATARAAAKKKAGSSTPGKAKARTTHR